MPNRLQKLYSFPTLVIVLSKGINELSMKWQKCRDSNGTYFDQLDTFYKKTALFSSYIKFQNLQT